MSDLDRYVEEQKKAIAEREKVLGEIEALKARFPDLRVDVNRWKTERYCAKSANAICNEWTHCHSCGCCNDSPLLAMPFIKVGAFTVYSDQPQICIGEKNAYQGGDDLSLNWDETLRKYSISEDLIKKIGGYFENQDKFDQDEDGG